MDCEKITAIDIDEKALKLSKKIYGDLGHHNIEYRISPSYDEIPIKKEEFDIVSCNAVIEHISPAHRPHYIRELSKSVKVGGYFMVSATPNRLWYKEGHTTGVWFLNYLPFKLKCTIGSKTKKWKGRLKSKEYDKWIEQGIVGATYKEIYTNLCRGKWDTSQDMIQKEYREFISINSKNLAKRTMLLMYANAIDNLYCKPNDYPSLAAGPLLQCSFLRKA